MAWTSPSTRATGDLITASIWNADIVNNLTALAAGARVYHNAAQSIANSTPTVLAFNSERYDTDTIHDTVTSNSRLTCKTAGKYLIAASVEFAGNATGYREVALLLNGATVIANQTVPSGLAGALSVAVAAEYALAVNDYVEARVFQTSGGPLNVNVTGNYSPEFSMHFLGG